VRILIGVQRGFLLLAMLGLSCEVPAQQADPASRLMFEVATIRPAKPNEPDGGIRPLPGGQEYWARDAPVKLIISLMYKLPMRQIEGGPDWIRTDGYDIEAKADHPTTIDNLHIMFQTLLADRFNLKFHMETRTGPVYALTVDKSGLKMKRDPNGEGWDYPMNSTGRVEFTGTRVPMKYFAWWLGQFAVQRDERPVVDETGLTGTWDFTLKFLPELPPNVSVDQLPPELANRPSIFEALPEQLGLKLEPAQGPVPYFVIDHIDRPSPN
jgi:uncharacterized protein (TIGR03435 family)